MEISADYYLDIFFINCTFDRMPISEVIRYSYCHFHNNYEYKFIFIFLFSYGILLQQ